MKKNALIIFVRNPELGKVKTRLAREIGDTRALEVYKRLLQHTHDAVLPCPADKYVYYADNIIPDDLWDEGVFYKHSQQGQDLGARMHYAFSDVFGKGYGKVLIMGSDCPRITPAILDSAFEHLGKNDVVIGPAADGGYYLLGLKEPFPALFMGKAWSTDQVLAATVMDTRKEGKSCFLLPVLSDVDTLEDLVKWENDTSSV